MDIKKFVLYECSIDGEFKEVSKNTFHWIVKSKFSDIEGAPIIVLIEINKQQLNYLETYDYKENEVGYFDIKGTFEVRKNKKDIPFLLLKADSVRLSSKRTAENKKEQERKKRKLKNKLENNSYNFIDWYKKLNF